MTFNDLKKIHDYLWEIPKSFRKDMQVPARIYADKKMLKDIFRDESMAQLVNMTTLPGIRKYAIVMPDVHEGYGAPIGGVFATDPEEDGIISPGACGYDISCGVRLLKSNLSVEDVKNKLEDFATQLQRDVPSGVGRGGPLRLKDPDLDKVLLGGAQQLVESGYGEQDDLGHQESNGVLEGGDPSLISSHAKNRGRDQLGTLGAGNHFVEVQRVDEIYDLEVAKSFGLSKDQVCIMVHTGSRGFGHQVATDYIRLMMQVMPKYGIKLPDRELACAPFNSPEGQRYFKAMKCGANFAMANRQMITHFVRGAWKKVMGENGGSLSVLYDVVHNLVKLEEYEIEEGKKPVRLVVHRKGATRSFGPNHPEVPEAYREVGQPVLIPGSMGTSSHVLVGSEQGMKEAFGSSCHGAGRTMSRHAALKVVRGETLKKDLEAQGIVVRGGSWRGLAEEAPIAYKDVDSVVNVVHNAGIAKKVARLKPLAVVKG